MFGFLLGLKIVSHIRFTIRERNFNLAFSSPAWNKEINYNFKVKSESEISQTTEQQQQVFKLTDMLQDHEHFSHFLSPPSPKTESLLNNEHFVTVTPFQTSEEVTVDHNDDDNVETRTEDQMVSLKNMLKDFSEADTDNSLS